MKEHDSPVRHTSLVSKPTLVPLLLDTAASQSRGIKATTAIENHHFLWENQLFLWPFSIAIFVYQRVTYSMPFETENDRFICRRFM